MFILKNKLKEKKLVQNKRLKINITIKLTLEDQNKLTFIK